MNKVIYLPFDDPNDPLKDKGTLNITWIMGTYGVENQDYHVVDTTTLGDKLFSHALHITEDKWCLICAAEGKEKYLNLNNYTISFWFLDLGYSSPNASIQPFIEIIYQGIRLCFYDTKYNSQTNVQGYIHFTKSLGDHTPDIYIGNNKWNHIALSYSKENSTTYIYINGELMWKEQYFGSVLSEGSIFIGLASPKLKELKKRYDHNGAYLKNFEIWDLEETGPSLELTKTFESAQINNITYLPGSKKDNENTNPDDNLNNTDNNISELPKPTSPFELIALTSNPSAPINGGSSVFIFPPPNGNILKYYSPVTIKYNGGVIYNISPWEQTTVDVVYNIHECPYGVLKAIEIDPQWGYSIIDFTHVSGTFSQFGTLEFWVYFNFVGTTRTKHEFISFMSPIVSETDMPEMIILFLENDSWSIEPYSRYLVNSTQYIASGTLTLSEQWVHIAFSFTGTYIVLFINGKVKYKIEKRYFVNILSNISFYLWGEPGISISYLTNVRYSNYVLYLSSFTPVFPPQPYDFNTFVIPPIPKPFQILATDEDPENEEEQQLNLPDVEEEPSIFFTYPINSNYNYYGCSEKEFSTYYDSIETKDITLIKHENEKNETWYDFIQTEDSKEVNGYIQFNVNDGIATYNGFKKYTIEMLVKANFSDNLLYCILIIGGQTEDQNSYLNFNIGNVDYQLTIKNPVTDILYQDSDPEFIFKNQWIHVAIVYDSETYFMLFINGNLKYKETADKINLIPYQICGISHSLQGHSVKITNFRYSKGVRYNDTFSEMAWNSKFEAQYYNTNM